MFFSSRRRHTRCGRDWSSDVCSSDLDADFVHEISIDPDTARGTITFYELPVTSLMMVPGVGVEPTQARGPRDFKSLASTVSATPARHDSTRDTAAGMISPRGPSAPLRLSAPAGRGARLSEPG